MTCLLGLPPEAQDAILVLLASPSWHVRSHALTALALAPTLSERSVRTVATALGDPSGDVRWRAAWALDRVEARGSEAALRARLEDPLPDVRAAVAVALSTLGEVGDDALPPLVEAVLASKPRDEMGNMLSMYEDVVGPRWFLVALGTVPGERYAGALGRHGAKGVAALRAAAQAAGAGPNRLWIDLYDAAGDAGTTALLEGLSASDEGARRAAALALARRGDGRVEVVEALAYRVEWEPRVNGHSERLDALLSLGEGALPAIRHLLRRGDEESRTGLLRALIALKEKGAPAIPEVVLLKDLGAFWNDEGRSEGTAFELAIRAIGRAGVPGLIAAVRSEDPAARQGAFQACRILGPEAKEALPALREALAAKRIPGEEERPPGYPIHPIE